jgi:hypothetical protein
MGNINESPFRDAFFGLIVGLTWPLRPQRLMKLRWVTGSDESDKKLVDEKIEVV